MCLWKKTPYQICFLCRTEMFYLFHVIRLIIWIEIWNKTVRRHNWNRRAQSTLVFLWAQVWTGAGFKRTAIINDAPNVTSVVFPSNGKVQRWEPLNNPWKRSNKQPKRLLWSLTFWRVGSKMTRILTSIVKVNLSNLVTPRHVVIEHASSKPQFPKKLDEFL